MQEVLVTNLFNNIIKNKITGFDSVKNTINVTSNIESLINDNVYVYLLVELSKDNGSLLVYNNIIRNISKLINVDNLSIVFVGDNKESNILNNTFDYNINDNIINYFDQSSLKMSFINDKKDIYKLLKQDNMINNNIYVPINNISDINMVNKKVNNAIIYKLDINESDILSKYIEYKAQIEKYRDLKLLINKGVIKDFDDEIKFSDKSYKYFDKEERKVNDKINNNLIDLKTIKNELIKYKLMFEYTDDLYLKTGLLNDNSNTGIGDIVIPSNILDLDVYDNFSEYRKTLRK